MTEYGEHAPVRLKAGLNTNLAERRVETVQRWLDGAVLWADNLQQIGIGNSPQTELTHQAVWLNVFESWRSNAGL